MLYVAFGRTETSAGRFAVSAFPPIATELRTSLEVRFVPGRDMRDARHPKEKVT